MSFKTPSLTYTSNCFNCNSDFVFWRGRFRYHCRCCGNNFCHDCVPNYCALPRIGIWKEVRTCDACYQKYNNPVIEHEELIENNDIFFDSALIPSAFDLQNNEDLADSFETINLDDDFQEIEEDNAQYLSVLEDIPGSKIIETPSSSSKLIGSIDTEMESNIFTPNSKTDVEDLVDDRQLEMALSLSRIENKFLKYTTSGDTTILSEEEEIEYALRLSALEEKAKTITSRLEIPNINSKIMSEDEELSLALAISKIENEDEESLRNGSKPPDQGKTNKNAADSRQVHCPICFEERLEYALIECGHVVCGDCKPKLEECPICRAEIRGTIRVYITN